MSWLIAFMINAALAAVDTAFYVSTNDPMILGGVIFCGACGLYCLVQASKP